MLFKFQLTIKVLNSKLKSMQQKIQANFQSSQCMIFRQFKHVKYPAETEFHSIKLPPKTKAYIQSLISLFRLINKSSNVQFKDEKYIEMHSMLVSCFSARLK